MQRQDEKQTRPTHFINEIEREFPDIWRQLEKHAKSDPLKPWAITLPSETKISKVVPAHLMSERPEFYARLTFRRTLIGMDDAKKKEVMQTVAMMGHSVDDALVTYPNAWMESLYAWRAMKMIYAFDPDFWEEINQTPLQGAPDLNIFDALPSDAFFVANGAKALSTLAEHDRDVGGNNGFFVFKKGNTITLSTSPINSLTFNIGQWSFESEIRKHVEQRNKVALQLLINTWDASSAKEKAIAEFHEELPSKIQKELKEDCEEWGGRLSALMYLCAKEPDIDRLKPPAPKVSRLGRRVHISAMKQEMVSHVGYRIGNVFRQAKKEDADREASGPTGRKASPHVRRAHWHTYWTGPRDNPAPSLRWISPVLVNAQSANDLTDTIHAVLTAEQALPDKGGQAYMRPKN